MIKNTFATFTSLALVAAIGFAASNLAQAQIITPAAPKVVKSAGQVEIVSVSAKAIANPNPMIGGKYGNEPYLVKVDAKVISYCGIELFLEEDSRSDKTTFVKSWRAISEHTGFPGGGCEYELSTTWVPDYMELDKTGTKFQEVFKRGVPETRTLKISGEGSGLVIEADFTLKSLKVDGSTQDGLEITNVRVLK